MARSPITRLIESHAAAALVAAVGFGASAAIAANGSQAVAQSAKGKGKLTIHFSSHEEFERIRQLLTATQAATTAPPQQQMFA